MALGASRRSEAIPPPRMPPRPDLQQRSSRTGGGDRSGERGDQREAGSGTARWSAARSSRGRVRFGPPCPTNSRRPCYQRSPVLLRDTAAAATNDRRPSLLRAVSNSAPNGRRRYYQRSPVLLRPAASAATNGPRRCSELLPSLLPAAMGTSGADATNWYSPASFAPPESNSSGSACRRW